MSETAAEQNLTFHIAADTAEAKQAINDLRSSLDTLTPQGMATPEALRAMSRKTITAPSGWSYVVRRPGIPAIVATGAVPSGYVQKFLFTNDKLEQPTDEDVLAYESVMRAITAATILDPRVVIGEAVNADEISIDDLPPGDAVFILTWAQGKGGHAQIGVAGGEVSAPALENFSDSQRRGDAVDVGGGGESAAQSGA
jgi:hypothetical protein